ncbi:MAG: hypothetical protein QOH17_2442 [Pseudonocardiales bacterium]|nr:hypothetical protein [Pseudonocardiales bacterium]
MIERPSTVWRAAAAPPPMIAAGGGFRALVHEKRGFGDHCEGAAPRRLPR